MQTWSSCTADIYYNDGSPSVTDDACYIVRIDDDNVEIAYDDCEGAVCYRGKNTGDGHFELTAPERDGHAVLHRMPGSIHLHGYWKESGYQGMWRITLNDPQH
jgi:hypothetical protein